MFTLQGINDTVRVAANQLSGDLKKTILKNIQTEYEGVLDEDSGLVVAVMKVENVSEGKVVPGDSGVYYSVDFEALTYKPEVNEVVEGVVSQITEFGAFIKIGPIEALTHVSQVVDDYINYDAKNASFYGKESGKMLKAEDLVLARIVTVSFKGNVSNSKIGLTMRQIGLGKKDWKKMDEKARDKRDKIKAAQSGGAKAPQQAKEPKEGKKK